MELSRWATAVEAQIASVPLRLVRRVMVFAQAASTQDVADACAAGEPGLLVLAGRQTEGRGRLGRRWVERGDLGVAATFTLAVAREHHALLSLAAGLAAAEAAERTLAGVLPAVPTLGLRWPNDVVERSTGAKLAGVLVETKGSARDGAPLLLVGIGLNVLHGEHDFPADLAARATSLRALGAAGTRLDAILALTECFDRAASDVLASDAARASLLEKWKLRDMLTGRPAAFIHDGTRHEGIVQGIRPDLSLRLRRSDGRSIDLPAATTSLVHDR